MTNPALARLLRGKPDGGPWTPEDHYINEGYMNPDGTWTDKEPKVWRLEKP